MGRPDPEPSVLFVYMGLNRRQLLPAVEAGKVPNSPFRGYTALRESKKVRADFLDLGDLPRWIPLLAKRFLPAGLLHLSHLPFVLRYDYVIASDSFLLTWLASHIGKLREKSHWIYIPINSSVLMRRHANHPLRLWALKIMWTSFARIVYITKGQLDDFLRMGMPEQKLVYLPFGIDTLFFAIPGEVPESEYVLSVGRDLGRDYPTLFATAKELPYKFIIATAPKNIPESIEIPSNVEIRYNVDAEGVRALYRGAICVAVLLKDEETTEGSDCTGQTVMLEALSAGQAIVVTDRAWIREYFVDGEEYLGIAPGDARGAATSIKKLWEHPELRKALSERGREKVRTSYSSETYAAGLLAIIEGLANTE